jgi:hypothetical protein
MCTNAGWAISPVSRKFRDYLITYVRNVTTEIIKRGDNFRRAGESSADSALLKRKRADKDMVRRRVGSRRKCQFSVNN